MATNREQLTLKRVAKARAQAEKVQQELEVATAELGLTNGAFDRSLPPAVRHGDLGWAIEQNARIEERVQKATEELEEVSDLLEKASSEGN